MSSDNDHSQSDNNAALESNAIGPHDELLVLGPGMNALSGNGFSGGSTLQPEILSVGFDPIWMLHSLRRRWVLAVGLGLLVALLFAFVVYLLIPPKATAIWDLKIASVKPHIAFNVDEGVESDFDIYKRTQAQLFKNRFVLDAALRNEEISGLPSIRDQEDKASWLKEHLKIQLPPLTELMRVSMEGENPQELQEFVRASVDAYMKEIVDKDRQDRLQTKFALTQAYEKTKEEIRRKTQSYNTLARELNTQESADARVDRSIAFSELNLLREEKERMEQELSRERLNIKLLHAQRDDPQLVEAQVDAIVAVDPQVVQLKQQLNLLELQLSEEMSISKRRNAPSLVRMNNRRASILNRIAQREAELRPRVQFQIENEPNATYEAAMKSATIREEYLVGRLTEIAKEEEVKVKLVKELGERSLELEARKAELDQLRNLATSMGSKIEAWDIELASPARITTIGEGPSIEMGLNSTQRYILICLGGLVGMCLTCFGVAFWDFQSRRLNTAAQIDEDLGIQVIGQLPALAEHGYSKNMDSKVAMLSEAIDNVRTTLMHFHSDRETQVVMITSAEELEGRTTVASQLAISLARAGRKTILVDADIRRPSLHRLYNLMLEDGFCEVLRGDARLEEAIRSSHVANLSVMTAGYCDAESIQALGQDRSQPLLSELRTEFDFVIVDAPPVLDLADALIIGQHVDGAIISARRDVSRVPAIHETRRKLKSVGIRVMGAVVNGVQAPVTDRVSSVMVVSENRLQRGNTDLVVPNPNL